MKEKIKIKGKTYVAHDAIDNLCTGCEGDENCDKLPCEAYLRDDGIFKIWKLKNHNPLKETLKVLALFAFLGVGAYFVHKSTECQAPAPQKKSNVDSLEELKRLDDIYLQKLVSLQNNDSLKMIGELYEINCAKIKEMER